MCKKNVCANKCPGCKRKEENQPETENDVETRD